MNVFWKRRALQDLDEIHAYVVQRSIKGAATVADRIAASVELIGDFPGVGRQLRKRPNIRTLPVGKYPYRIYYSIDADAVMILHVRHTSRRVARTKDL